MNIWGQYFCVDSWAAYRQQSTGQRLLILRAYEKTRRTGEFGEDQQERFQRGPPHVVRSFIGGLYQSRRSEKSCQRLDTDARGGRPSSWFRLFTPFERFFDDQENVDPFLTTSARETKRLNEIVAHLKSCFVAAIQIVWYGIH